MKKLLPLLLLVTTPVYANIKQEFVTSAQISIDSPYVITNAAPNSYSISGNNITTSTGSGDSIVTNGIGGLNLSSITNGLAGVTATNKTVTTAGSAFSLILSITLFFSSAITKKISHTIHKYSLKQCQRYMER